MKLSISTSATEHKLLSEGLLFEPVEGIRQCYEAGFRILDVNYARAAANQGPLARDDWEDWGRMIADLVSELGLTVEQTHGHWFHLCKMKSQEDLLWNQELVRKSIRCSSMFGGNPWVVLHPRSVFDADGCNLQKSKEYNYSVFMELGELAAKCGTRIAVENTFINRNNGYCSNAHELSELLQSLNSDLFGACWDFGHANRMGLDHLKSLDTIAPFLRVVHCHDNKSHNDDHFIPYFGNVPWKEILPKLKQIGYKGNLNMEVHVFYKGLPQSLRMEGLRFMRQVGEQMIKFFEEA